MRFFKALKPIKAISFDLDDTLYDNVPIIAKAEEDFACYLCEKFKLPDYTSNYNFWAEIKTRTLEKRPELINDVTLLRVIALQDAFVHLHLPLSEQKAYELITYFIYLRSQITVPKSSVEVLKQLRLRFPLAALSNGNSDLSQSGLIDCFDYDLRPSLQHCAAKPSADLFNAYAKLVNCMPDEILHIGDDPVTDVQGAMQAGCQCAWLAQGYAKRGVGEAGLTVVPTLVIESLKELSFLWTN